MESNAKGNKDIWKLAKYLADMSWEFDDFLLNGSPLVDFEDYNIDNRNFFYDKAVELMKRIGPNGVFT